MTTLLRDSIQRIRTYKKLIEKYPESDSIDAYSRAIEIEWKCIRQIFRSDEEHIIYEVEGLYEENICYWSSTDLAFALDDVAVEDTEITIKVKTMTGTDIGRMRVLDI